jgi:hypothetical protein
MWTIGKIDVSETDFAATKTKKQKVDLLYKVSSGSFMGVSKEKVGRLCRDFPRRVKLMLLCGGNSISKLLNSHISAPRPQDIRVCRVRDFLPAEDANIRREGPARRWTALLRGHRRGPNVITRILKWRFDFLSEVDAMVLKADLRAYNSRLRRGFSTAFFEIQEEEEELAEWAEAEDEVDDQSSEPYRNKVADFSSDVLESAEPSSDSSSAESSDSSGEGCPYEIPFPRPSVEMAEDFTPDRYQNFT